MKDRNGAAVFESGAMQADGSIKGNDNDRDAGTFEPHYSEIDSADQVQIYEAIMTNAAGKVTTGLLSGVRYVKDNRLLPTGFDKATAGADIAVRGAVLADGDFIGGEDRDPLCGGGPSGRGAIHGGGGTSLPADRISVGAEPAGEEGDGDRQVRESPCLKRRPRIRRS